MSIVSQLLLSILLKKSKNPNFTKIITNMKWEKLATILCNMLQKYTKEREQQDFFKAVDEARILWKRSSKKFN